MSRTYRKEKHSDIKWMRPKVIALTKEMPGSKKIRTELGQVNHLDELKKLAESHIKFYGDYPDYR